MAAETTGVTLICWEHTAIHEIANAIVPADRRHGDPPGWPAGRFDVVWSFSRAAGTSDAVRVHPDPPDAPLRRRGHADPRLTAATPPACVRLDGVSAGVDPYAALGTSARAPIRRRSTRRTGRRSDGPIRTPAARRRPSRRCRRPTRHCGTPPPKAGSQRRTAAPSRRPIPDPGPPPRDRRSEYGETRGSRQAGWRRCSPSRGAWRTRLAGSPGCRHAAPRRLGIADRGGSPATASARSSATRATSCAERREPAARELRRRLRRLL